YQITFRLFGLPGERTGPFSYEHIGAYICGCPCYLPVPAVVYICSLKHTCAPSVIYRYGEPLQFTVGINGNFKHIVYSVAIGCKSIGYLYKAMAALSFLLQFQPRNNNGITTCCIA